MVCINWKSRLFSVGTAHVSWQFQVELLPLTWATDNAAPEAVGAVTTALISGLEQLSRKSKPLILSRACGHTCLTMLLITMWLYLLVIYPANLSFSHRSNSFNLATCSFACILALLGDMSIGKMQSSKGESVHLQGKLQRKLMSSDLVHHLYNKLLYLVPSSSIQLNWGQE